MSKTYDHHALEVKWQAYWEEHRTFRVADDQTKPKFYCLDMFPYPSDRASTSATSKAIPRRISYPATNA